MSATRTGAALACLLLLCANAHAQPFEVLVPFDGISSSAAQAAMSDMFSDPDMQNARATLYAADFGVEGYTHLIVADYDDYAERDDRDAIRRASHGWSRFQLAMQDAEFHGINMAGVLADHGEPRHTAAYLAAFIANVSDPAAYAQALADLDAAQGNPGVLRLVALRTGDRTATHAVLVGGESFAAVNTYLDELFASDAFAEFADSVSGIREIVRVSTYRRLGAWGY